MTTAFIMSVYAAEIFYSVCEELKADTEEERVRILQSMAQLGMLKNIVEIQKTKEEYIAHLRKHFKVTDLTKPSSLSEQDDQQEK